MSVHVRGRVDRVLSLPITMDRLTFQDRYSTPFSMGSVGSLCNRPANSRHANAMQAVTCFSGAKVR